jgi:hypothetical protein
MKTASGNSSGKFAFTIRIICLIIQFATSLALPLKAIGCVKKGEQYAISLYKEIIRWFDYHQFVKRKWILFFADGPGLFGPSARYQSY